VRITAISAGPGELVIVRRGWFSTSITVLQGGAVSPAEREAVREVIRGLEDACSCHGTDGLLRPTIERLRGRL
jgi:hypothetical protein